MGVQGVVGEVLAALRRAVMLGMGYLHIRLEVGLKSLIFSNKKSFLVFDLRRL